MDIKSVIRTIPDYPKPGIMFRDITTLLNDAQGFRSAIDALVLVSSRELAQPDSMKSRLARSVILMR